MKLIQKHCRLCPFKDKDKSKPHNEKGVIVNPKCLDYCTFTNKYTETFEPCLHNKKDYIEKEIICNKCKRVLLTYWRPKTNKDQINGLIDAHVHCYLDKTDKLTEGLMAYNDVIRKDKLVGLECSCGNDTRTEIHGNKEKAEWDNPKGAFMTKEKK